MAQLRPRSINEIHGIPVAAGLSPLPAPHNLPVPFLELRIRLAGQLKKAMEPEPEEGAVVPPPPPGETTREEALESFKREGLEGWVADIRATIPETYGNSAETQRALERFDTETALFKATLDGEGIARPNLDTPERQLLWSLALSHRHLEGTLTDPLRRDAVGRAIINSEYVSGMLMEFGYNVGLSAKVELGIPGSWYFHNPVTKIINMDLTYSLIGGGVKAPSGLTYAHADAIFRHEQGHNLYTREYPARMKAVWLEMRELHHKGGGSIPELPSIIGDELPKIDNSQSELTIEEYKRLMHLENEWRLRHHLFNAAEDNCVNRFAVDLGDPEAGGSVDQDLGDSLNVFSVEINGLGKKDPKPRKDTPEARYSNLCHALNMNFFVANAAVPDTDEGWEHLHVHRDWIKNFTRPGKDWAEDFANLRALTQTLEDDKPYLNDMVLNQFSLNPITDVDDLRARADALALTEPYMSKALLSQWQVLNQTEIRGHENYSVYWSARRARTMDAIFEHYAEPLLEQLLQKADQEIDKAVEQMQKEAEEGEGQEKGDGQGGQQPGEGEGKEGEGAGEGQGKPGQGKGQSKPGKGGGGQGGVRVAGLGKKKAEPLPGGNPQDNRTREQEARQGKSMDAAAEGAKDAPSTDDLKRARIDGGGIGDLNSAKPDISRGSGQPRQAPKNMSKPEERASNGKGTERSPFDDIDLGDGTLYSEMQNTPEYVATVRNVARFLIKHSQKMRQYDTRPSPESHTLVPEGSDFRRLNHGRIESLFQRIAEGKAQIDDYRLFREEELFVHPTLGNLIMLLDGSGSMSGSRLEITTKLAAILYDAGRLSGYRVYATLFGDDAPWAVINPDMKHSEITERIDGVLKGKNCGTCLAPAVPDILERMGSTRAHPNKRVGWDHWFVISDGGIADEKESHRTLQGMMDVMPSATLDILLPQQNDNSLSKVADLLIPRKRHQKVERYHIANDAEISEVFAKMIANRFLHCGKMESQEQGTWRRKVREAGQKTKMEL